MLILVTNSIFHALSKETDRVTLSTVIKKIDTSHHCVTENYRFYFLLLFKTKIGKILFCFDENYYES